MRFAEVDITKNMSNFLLYGIICTVIYFIIILLWGFSLILNYMDIVDMADLALDNIYIYIIIMYIYIYIYKEIHI